MEVVDVDSLEEDMKRVAGKIAILGEHSEKNIQSAESRVQSFGNTLEVIRDSLPSMLDTLQRIQTEKLQQQSAIGASDSPSKRGKGSKKTVPTVRSTQDKEDAGMSKLVNHLAAADKV